MRVDRISINDSRIRVQYGEESEGLKAIPLFIDTDNEIQVVAHRVMEGPHQGSILTPDKYVVLGCLEEYEHDEQTLIIEVGALVEGWVNAGYRGQTKKEDILNFSKDLISFFKSNM